MKIVLFAYFYFVRGVNRRGAWGLAGSWMRARNNVSIDMGWPWHIRKRQ